MTTKLTPEQIRTTLDLHAKWLRGEPGGVRAYLRGAYLRGADLVVADLAGADLTGADLTGADLNGADLRDADLTGANLAGVDLRGADLTGAKIEATQVTPRRTFDQIDPARTGPVHRGSENGPVVIGYKKLRDGEIATLRIPADARIVSTPLGTKCRAEYAVVESIVDRSGETLPSGFSLHCPAFVYRVGEVVRPAPSSPFSDDFRVECTGGIHFFTERSEAKAYA